VDKGTQRNFLDSLGNQLGFKHMEDWYKITFRQIKDYGGSGLLQIYKGSPSKLVASIYSEHEWKPSRFNLLSNWRNKNFQREFLDRLGEELGFESLEDWYSITARQISSYGGAGLLFQYGASPSKLIMSIYEDFPWQKSRFYSPQNWEDKSSVNDFVRGLYKQLGLKSMDDWYGVTKRQILQNRGGSLLLKYENSLPNLLRSVYSNHCWKENFFTLKGYWELWDHQKDFMDQLGKELGYLDMSDWYKITAIQIRERGGGTLLAKYANSPFKLVTSVYSNHRWKEDFNSQNLNFLNNLGRRLGFKTMNDWYRITKRDISYHGGSTFLRKHKGHPSELIMSVYHQHHWTHSNFKSKISSAHWNHMENRLELVKRLTKDLYIKYPSDWYRISLSQIGKVFRNMWVFQKYPLEVLLLEAYPNHEWHTEDIFHRLRH
jgi:hypothetical protein